MSGVEPARLRARRERRSLAQLLAHRVDERGALLAPGVLLDPPALALEGHVGRVVRVLWLVRLIVEAVLVEVELGHKRHPGPHHEPHQLGVARRVVLAVPKVVRVARAVRDLGKTENKAKRTVKG